MPSLTLADAASRSTKMADEKKKGRGDLYDHKSSKRAMGKVEAKPEKKAAPKEEPDPAEIKPLDKPEELATMDEPIKKRELKEDGSGTKATTQDQGGNRAYEEWLDGLRTIHKSHEAERRDAGEAHAKMTKRHEKMLKDHFKLVGGDGESPEEPAAKEGGTSE